jgi:glycosyltransferase involved in cell wall biosynthesis
LRILLATYSAESHSSYGLVTRELWTRLTRMNPSWQVVQHGWFHESAEKVGWLIEPTKMATTSEGPKPVHEDKWGQTSFEPLVAKFKPDVVWALGDPYMMEHMDRHRRSYGFRLVKHVAVDGAPQPALWGPTLKEADRLVPITDFGSRALERIVGARHKHIYHGVDVNRFMPFDRSTRKRPEILKMTSKTFVLGFVGHSQFRKQPWNLFKLLRYLRDGAFVICKECDEATLAPWDDIAGKTGDLPTSCRCGASGPSLVHHGPQDVCLWYHTFNRGSVEYHPEVLKDTWGVAEATIFTAKMGSAVGAPDRDLPDLYKMFDAYVSLSGAEGFCIPIIEAMASGLPVVYTDYSGQAEVGAHAGLPVRYLELQPNTGIPINRAIADVSHAVRQVMRLIQDQDLYRSLREKGTIAAHDVFSWDVIACQWDEVLQSVVQSRKIKTLGFVAT